MNGDIAEAKQKLPLPALLHQLGLCEHAKKSARCPFHDDKRNSFSVWKNGSGLWFWKCHAGCGEGDEITFLEKYEEISNSESIKRYLEMAGVNGATQRTQAENAQRTSPPHTKRRSDFDWDARVEAFTEEEMQGFAKSRGYSLEFVCWLKDNKLVGLHDGCVAFPIRDESGKIVAAHYRSVDGEWRRYPT